MSGVAIVRYLLAQSSGLTAAVPSTRIQAGVLPLKTELPAISVTQISGQQKNNLSMNSTAYSVTDRVQVTVLSSTYPEAKSILDLVRSACPLSLGIINGFISQGVLPDAVGPDLFDQERQLHSQSQDYLVTYIRSV